MIENNWLLAGIIYGGLLALFALLIGRRLWNIHLYTITVRGYLGDDADDYYDEQTMLDFYNMNMHPADCAREMIAVNCNE